MSAWIWVSAAVSFASACYLTKKLRSPGSKLYFADAPNERSLHQVPTPRTGGLAILSGLFLGLLLLAAAGFDRSILWILLPLFALAAVSFVDDLRGVPVIYRLGIHLLIAAAVVCGMGVSMSTVSLAGAGSLQLGGIAAAAFSVVFLVWMVNLYNFMDGMDGLASGMAAIGFAFLAFLAWRRGHNELYPAFLLISASSAGFLPHNLPPAKIFMGDVGSTSLGFLAGLAALTGIKAGLFDFWIPVIIFSPFIMDATVTLVLRFLKGRKIWQAHREHYYQRLVLCGWSHKKTVLLYYAVMLACGVCAYFYDGAREAAKGRILAFAAGFYALVGASAAFIENQYFRRKFDT